MWEENETVGEWPQETDDGEAPPLAIPRHRGVVPMWVVRYPTRRGLCRGPAMTGHQRRILMLALHCELTGDVDGAGYWYGVHGRAGHESGSECGLNGDPACRECRRAVRWV